MILALTFVFISLATIAYYWNYLRPKKFKWTVPGLESQDKNLGNLGEINSHGGLHPFLVKKHEEFGGIFRFYWGKDVVVSISCPEMLKATQTLFDRPGMFFEAFAPMIGTKSIQFINTPNGQLHRKVLDRHFSFATIGTYYKTFVDVGEEAIPKWKSQSKNIPLREEMFIMTIKAIVRSCFGKDFFQTEEKVIELKNAYDICFNEMEVRVGGDFPSPGSVRQSNFEASLNKMRAICDEIVEQRRAMKNIKDEEKNLFDIVVESDDLYKTNEEIFDMFMTFMVAGFHETGNMMTWAVYFLCQNPDVIDKLNKEIEDVLGDKEFTMEDMSKFVYTKQIIDETLRAAVLGTFAGRYANKDMEIGGHVIPDKTPIIQALGPTLHDKNIWPNPEKFDPDRFSPDAPKRHPNAYQPFGFSGKRKCPGFRFTYYEGVIFLIAIFRNFNVSLVPGQNVVMQHRLICQPKDEIYINVTAKQ